MTGLSPYYFDGITSAPKIVTLSLTDQSLVIAQDGQTIAVWGYGRLHVKEDWTNGGAGAILGFKDNPDASLTIYNQKQFESIISRLPRKHRATSLIPSHYHHLFLMAIVAVAVVILAFPLFAQLASIVTYLVPKTMEEKLGNYALDDMADIFDKCDDKVALEHLQIITNRLIKASGDKDMKAEIHFFKSTTPNAFSLPGNKIAVLSEFLKDSKSENEIAAVLAHEMGHMAKRDALEAFIEEQGVNAIVTLIGSSGGYSDLTKFASFVQAMNYSRKKEFRADEYGAKLLLKAGYSPKALSSFLSRLDDEHPLLNGKAAEYTEYLEFLSTHPDTKERVRRLNQLGGTDTYKPSLTTAQFTRLKQACQK